MSIAEPDFSFRQIALPALLPSLLFAIGEGAIIPLIPALASNLGASLAVAGFIAGMTMLGQLVGDIPSGWVVSRIGERRAMIYAAALAILAVVLCLLAASPAVFGVGIFFLGLAAAIFSLARHAFLTTFVPRPYRARALSTLGGTFRAGWFIGPFLGAGLIALTGDSQAVFWIQGACAVAIIVLLIVVPDPIEKLSLPDVGGEFIAEESTGLVKTLWGHRGLLARIGSGVALVMGLRAARMIILPLWAVSLGLSESNTALIIGVGGALDFALFYTSGQIMDRFGRLFSVIPSMLGMGVALLALSVTHDLPAALTWFIVLTIVLGISNGVGSGIVMTLGADLAPPDDPAPFLGAFRFTGDLGTAGAPLLISLVVAVASLPLAAAVLGLLGFVGAGVLLRYVPRYAPGADPRHSPRNPPRNGRRMLAPTPPE
ncbi:MFS transporter [Subtercola frigoramans]|uniref:MFS family permease n=1 Tax=Subtercola frigoramans TaxID=120298 RepID=A0ABS2L3Z1_9MICO|nr:MFS transporter [Subtercola frigoramans]MBM7471820.1 MFS family permease [Subtercola frigoramans]